MSARPSTAGISSGEASDRIGVGETSGRGGDRRDGCGEPGRGTSGGGGARAAVVGVRCYFGLLIGSLFLLAMGNRAWRINPEDNNADGAAVWRRGLSSAPEFATGPQDSEFMNPTDDEVLPSQMTSEEITAAFEDEPDAGPRYDYSVLIVSYHKTGHDLQMDLVDMVSAEFSSEYGIRLGETGNKSPLTRRHHPSINPCSRFKLQTGTIGVQHAPDLFCNPENLSRILMEGGHNHTSYDRGVKVVHLVRDPFNIATSNYRYHARMPTPEPWIRHQDPCDIMYPDGFSFADMVLPAMSFSHYDYLDVDFGDEPLLRTSEFEDILSDCRALYRTQPGLENGTLLDHLLNYDPPEGIRLMTSEMMIQGYDNGGDILRMANNIIKFRQAELTVANTEEYTSRGKSLEVYTMSLDDFILNPERMAHRFLDFVFEGTSASHVPTKHRKKASKRYRSFYEQKKKFSKHITSGSEVKGSRHSKNVDSGELEAYLRNFPPFARPLMKIETLVRSVVESSRARYGQGPGRG